MYKKFLFGFLSLAVFANAFASFNDLEQHIFEDEVLKAFESNLVKGYSDGSFRPDQPISRAEALKILLGDLIPKDYSSSNLYFSDYSQNDWFFQYLNYSKENNIVNGYSDGTFKPGNFISIAESLKILFQTRNIEVTQNQNFDWFENLNLKAIELNLYEKSPNNFVNVNDYITRSELVYLIDKISNESFETNNLNFNWSYQNNDFSLSTLKSDTYFKLENDGILVLFEDGFLSFEILQNNFESFEDSLKIFKPLDSNKIVNSKYFSSKSLAYANNDSYYEQAMDLEKNLIYRISIKKSTNLKEILENLSFNTSNLKTFNNLSDLKQNIKDIVLVEGAFDQILNKINNKKVLYTDVIGIGMGPIDYIYLIDLNLTVKHERNSSTILQIKDGENSDF